MIAARPTWGRCAIWRRCLALATQDVLWWFILVVALLLDPAAVLLLLAATRKR